MIENKIILLVFFCAFIGTVCKTFCTVLFSPFIKDCEKKKFYIIFNYSFVWINNKKIKKRTSACFSLIIFFWIVN